MHPDLQHIYDELFAYTQEETIMNCSVNMRVDDDIIIKLYINDEEGINGTFKKPIMNVGFSKPGLLTVKFLLLDQNIRGYLQENFKMMPLGKDSFRVDFEELSEFEKFIGSL